MRTITIKSDARHNTSVNDIYDQEEYFYPEYCEAASCIDKIVSSSNESALAFEEKCNRTRWRKTAGKNFDEIEWEWKEKYLFGSYPNNILAFCAKRGHGKTSCMRSFSKALSELPINSNSISYDEHAKKAVDFWRKAHGHKEGNDFTDNGLVSSKSFCVIGPIDPSAMEQGDSLLRTIILRMNMEVRGRLDADSMEMQQRYQEERYRKLRDQFSDTFRKLVELKQPRPISKDDYYDELTQLEQSGDSVLLRQSFMELIREFLSFLQYDMLVIQVDDADLNSERAFEMMEDIRNYCVGPRVIVLMALHLGTTRNCIEQEYVKRYTYLLRRDLSITHMEMDKCRETTERYIDKLLPTTHQIHLPYFERFLFQGSCEINLKIEKKQTEKNRPGKENKQPEELQAKLFEIIYRKTGIVLLPREDYYHNFLPSRFRELTHMISFFEVLEDVRDVKINEDRDLLKILEIYASGENYSKRQEEVLRLRIYNLRKTDTYLREHWSPLVLTKRQMMAFSRISDGSNSILFNRALNEIRNYVRTEKFSEDTIKVVEAAYPSYAGVSDALHEIDLHNSYDKQYAFTSAIRMLFTIRLSIEAMQILLYHGNFSQFARMCGQEIFGRGLSFGDHRDYVSRRLMQKILPEVKFMQRGWGDCYLPLQSVTDHGSLLNETELTMDILYNKDGTISDIVNWFYLSLDYYLFNKLSNVSIREKMQRRHAIDKLSNEPNREKKRIRHAIDKLSNVSIRELMQRGRDILGSDKDFFPLSLIEEEKEKNESNNKNAFDSVPGILMLICNYDMRRWLIKYLGTQIADRKKELTPSSDYRVKVKYVLEGMDELFSGEGKYVPKQKLKLGCKFKDAIDWNEAEEDDVVSSVIQLASPELCLEIIVDLLTAFSLSDLQNEDARDLFVIKYRVKIDLLKGIPLTQEWMHYIEKECEKEWKQKNINIGNWCNEKIKEVKDFNEACANLPDRLEKIVSFLLKENVKTE